MIISFKKNDVITNKNLHLEHLYISMISYYNNAIAGCLNLNEDSLNKTLDFSNAMNVFNLMRLYAKGLFTFFLWLFNWYLASQ